VVVGGAGSAAVLIIIAVAVVDLVTGFEVLVDLVELVASCSLWAMVNIY
jgi:hypothetical protein